MLHTLDEDNDDEDVVTDNLKYGHVRVDVLKSCSNAYRRMGKNATVVQSMLEVPLKKYSIFSFSRKITAPCK